MSFRDHLAQLEQSYNEKNTSSFQWTGTEVDFQNIRLYCYRLGGGLEILKPGAQIQEYVELVEEPKTTPPSTQTSSTSQAPSTPSNLSSSSEPAKVEEVPSDTKTGPVEKKEGEGGDKPKTLKYLCVFYNPTFYDRGTGPNEPVKSKVKVN
jgi:hypothetical protein